MKKIALAAAAVSILFAGAASAADMAPRYTKAPPPVVAPLWSWTGFYIGGNVGGGWTDNQDYRAADPFNTLGLAGGAFVPALASSNDGTGIMGGLHAGYNFQVGPSFLVGVEGDISGADVKNSARVGPLISTLTNSDSFFAASEKVRWAASIRGRAGFIAGGDWLLYGTAGWGWADVQFNANALCAGTGVNPCVNPAPGMNAPFSGTITKNGAVYGGGVEYHVPGSQWIIGAEYLRYDLGSTNVLGLTRNVTTGAPFSFSAACPAGTACVNYSASDLHLNEVRVRASYQFGGPVVARY